MSVELIRPLADCVALPNMLLTLATELYPPLPHESVIVKKYVALVPTLSFVKAFRAASLVVAPVPPCAIGTAPVILLAATSLIFAFVTAKSAILPVVTARSSIFAVFI